MFQPPKHLLQARRTSARDQEAGAARDQEVDQSTSSRRGELQLGIRKQGQL